jgi:hypothetical protein
VGHSAFPAFKCGAKCSVEEFRVAKKKMGVVDETFYLSKSYNPDGKMQGNLAKNILNNLTNREEFTKYKFAKCETQICMSLFLKKRKVLSIDFDTTKKSITGVTKTFNATKVLFFDLGGIVDIIECPPKGCFPWVKAIVNSILTVKVGSESDQHTVSWTGGESKKNFKVNLSPKKGSDTIEFA